MCMSVKLSDEQMDLLIYFKVQDIQKTITVGPWKLELRARTCCYSTGESSMCGLQPSQCSH